jgi:pyruvate,water dikinase
MDIAVPFGLWGKQAMADPIILWFEEITEEATPLVGKKSVSLAHIGRIGLRGPRGFALTIQAWDLFLAKTGLGAEITDFLRGFESGALKDLDTARKAGDHISRQIRMPSLPEALSGPLLESYDRLCGMCGVADVPVAVRSSGTVSRPGLFASFLHIRGKADLEKSVKACWASAYAPRALAMDAQHERGFERRGMGVAVCEFVRARAAGVLFTAHPITGNPHKWVIEASWGLGESVVQASVVPDRFTIDVSDKRIESRDIHAKASQVISTGSGVEVVRVEPGAQKVPSLTDEEIWALVGAAEVVVESLGGIPQDIEWALSSEKPFPDNVFLLQARPVAGYQQGFKSIRKPSHKTQGDHIADLMIERLFS